MQRVTITLDNDLSEEVDQLVIKNGYQNRSEAIRDFVRLGIQQAKQDAGVKGKCVAALVYVYDHAARDLSKRLVENFHGHHDLSLAGGCECEHDCAHESAHERGRARERVRGYEDSDEGRRIATISKQKGELPLA